MRTLPILLVLVVCSTASAREPHYPRKNRATISKPYRFMREPVAPVMPIAPAVPTVPRYELNPYIGMLPYGAIGGCGIISPPVDRSMNIYGPAGDFRGSGYFSGGGDFQLYLEP